MKITCSQAHWDQGLLVLKDPSVDQQTEKMKLCICKCKLYVVYGSWIVPQRKREQENINSNDLVNVFI